MINLSTGKIYAVVKPPPSTALCPFKLAEFMTGIKAVPDVADVSIGVIWFGPSFIVFISGERSFFRVIKRASFQTICRKFHKRMVQYSSSSFWVIFTHYALSKYHNPMHGSIPFIMQKQTSKSFIAFRAGKLCGIHDAIRHDTRKGKVLVEEKAHRFLPSCSLLGSQLWA